MAVAARLDRIATALQDNAYTASEHFLQGMAEVLSAFFQGVSETAQHPVQSTQKAANAVITYLTNDYNANNEQLYLAAVQAVDEWQRDPARAAGKTVANAAIGAATSAAGEVITTGAKVCTAGASKAVLARIAKARKAELVLEQDVVEQHLGVTAEQSMAAEQRPSGTEPGAAANGVPEPIELTLLKANTRYWDNRTGYEFQTDWSGRPSRIKAGNLLLEKGRRKGEQQTIAGGSNRLPTDQGGHMLAARFAGPENLVNLLAQDANLNVTMWRRMENLWATALSEGKTVQVEITPIYDGTSWRPTEFYVEYAIDGKVGAVSMKNAPGGI
jgi:hypothetical protein